MKRTAFWVVLFITGGLLALITDLTLGYVWTSLEWRKPVADWLIAKGLPPIVAGYWGLIWINLSDWVVLLLLGAVIGRVARSGKWFRYTLTAVGGFVADSLIYTVPYCIRLAHLDGSLAVGTIWRLMVWDLISLLLPLLAAWVFSRTRNKPVVVAKTPIVDN